MKVRHRKNSLRIGSMVICKKCKWYPRILNALSDNAPMCNVPVLLRVDHIDGKLIHPYCSNTNKNGNCPHYQKR